MVADLDLMRKWSWMRSCRPRPTAALEVRAPRAVTRDLLAADSSLLALPFSGINFILLFVSGILRKRLSTPRPSPSIITPSLYQRPAPSFTLDGLDLEVQRDQAKDKGLQVLHQVVEHPQPLWVRRLAHVNEGPDLRRLHKGGLVVRCSRKMNKEAPPRRTRARSLTESQAPGGRPCSSGATSYRPPCPVLASSTSRMRTSEGLHLLHDLTRLDDSPDLIDYQRADTHW